MILNGKVHRLVDHVFWIVLIVFTNPGNILGALGEDSSDGGANMTDFLFVILVLCFMIVYKKWILFSNKEYSKLLRYLFIFLIYYLFVFSFFIPQFKNVAGYSVLGTFIKIRHGIINIALVIMVYHFYLRSSRLFFKYFIWSSIIVISLFLITVLGGVDIIPVMVSDRGFIAINRLMMENYGLMPILITMGVVLLVFNFQFKNRFSILVASIMMLIAWIFSLIRRELLSTVILFFLAMFIRNFIMRRSIIDIKKLLSLSIYALVLIFAMSFTFPDYSAAVMASLDETIYTIKYGRSSVGYEDARLGFGKDALQQKIIDNYIIGTGYDDNWRNSEEAGWEASDYPFLAAIAMCGILGLLVFLPVYVLLGKCLYKDIFYFRRTGMNLSSFEEYTTMVFIVYFIFDLATYVYWFLPVSLFTHGGHKKWYVFLAMYFAARQLVQASRVKKNELLINKELNENCK